MRVVTILAYNAVFELVRTNRFSFREFKFSIKRQMCHRDENYFIQEIKIELPDALKI